MLVVLAAVLALALSTVLGGRLSALGEARLRGLWLLVLAALLKIFELTAPSSLLPAVWPFLLPAQSILVAVFAGLNFKVRALVVILIGAVLNLAVEALNGGYMPVQAAAAGSAGELDVMRTAGHAGSYTLLTAGTRLPWLADTILPPPPLARAVSPGDVIMAAGVALALLALARTPMPPAKAVVGAYFTKLRRFLTAS